MNRCAVYSNALDDFVRAPHHAGDKKEILFEKFKDKYFGRAAWGLMLTLHFLYIHGKKKPPEKTNIPQS